MKVQKRRVNTKGHTKAYKVGGKWRTREEAVKLAKRGKIDGVRVGRSGSVEYITSTSHPRLDSLPTIVMH